MHIEDWILLAAILAWIFLMAWLCKGSGNVR